MAQRLVREGEEVPLLAMFNGPSPTWIRAQSLANHAGPPEGEPQERPANSPGFVHRWLRELVVRSALATGRPLPERLRANHFLRLNAKAEQAYEPQTYPGRIWIFHGQDLYDDPELGWGGLAEGGLESYVVPGEHSNNRQMMNEPHVQVVGERLKAVLGSKEHLARSDTATTAADFSGGSR